MATRAIRQAFTTKARYTMAKAKATQQVVKCTTCGKVLHSASAIATGKGCTCAQQLTPHKFYIASVPVGYSTIASLHLWCDNQNPPIAISKFVKAFGGDKGAGKPAHMLCASLYLGNTRYVHTATMQAYLTGKPLPKVNPVTLLQPVLHAQFSNFVAWCNGTAQQPAISYGQFMG